MVSPSFRAVTSNTRGVTVLPDLQRAVQLACGLFAVEEALGQAGQFVHGDNGFRGVREHPALYVPVAVLLVTAQRMQIESDHRRLPVQVSRAAQSGAGNDGIETDWGRGPILPQR